MAYKLVNDSSSSMYENIIIVIIIIVIAIALWFFFSNKNNHEGFASDNLATDLPVQEDKYKTFDNTNAPTPELPAINSDKVSYSGQPGLDNPACNLINPTAIKNMDSYRDQYYQMYAHQVACPKACGLDGGRCGSNNSCFGTEIADTNALNNLRKDVVNSKPCSTCTKYRDPYPFPGDMDSVDIKQDVIKANISNFVNFKDNVNLDSIGETQVDKLAEFRACQGAGNTTCDLDKYGSSIASVYNNLVATPSTNFMDKISNVNPDHISGVLDDQGLASDYAPYNKSD